MEIIVKKNGRITIPVKIRRKLKWSEGTHLNVVETEAGIVLKPKGESFWDIVGKFPLDPVKAAELDKELHEMRHEDCDNREF